MRFGVLMVVSVQVTSLWDVTPCSRVDRYATIFRVEEVILTIEAALCIWHHVLEDCDFIDFVSLASE
jgi:hypothetical protein